MGEEKTNSESVHVLLQTGEYCLECFKLIKLLELSKEVSKVR